MSLRYLMSMQRRRAMAYLERKEVDGGVRGLGAERERKMASRNRQRPPCRASRGKDRGERLEAEKSDSETEVEETATQRERVREGE